MSEQYAGGALLLDIDGCIARLVFNRPDKRNAVNQAMWQELPRVTARIDADSAISVLVVTGAGGHFAAGADISEFEANFSTSDAAEKNQSQLQHGIEALAAMRKPVVAAIEGACIGGGVALALACDIRVGSAAARFAVTPARLGLVYPSSDTTRLVAAIGPGQAARLLFTGRIVDGTEAMRIGLIDQLAGPGEALATALDEATSIAAASQYSVRATKAIIAATLGGATVDEAALARDAVAGEDFQEGRRAFLEKRTPRFTFR